MIIVNDLAEARATPGAVLIEATNPPRVYFADDVLPSHCVVNNPPPRPPTAREKLERATGLTIEQIKQELSR